MPHAQVKPTKLGLFLIIGQPGVGYETIIAELNKISVGCANAWDRYGFRTNLQTDTWMYDLNSFLYHLLDAQVTQPRLRYISAGGSGSPELLALPWKGIIYLKMENVAEYMRRTNSFRARVDLPPLPFQRVQTLLKEGQSLIEGMLEVTLSPHLVVKAEQSPSVSAMEIFDFAIELDRKKDRQSSDD